MRTITLSSKHQEPFEIGALLVAALAFPDPEEQGKMHEAAIAWSATQIAATIAASPSEATTIAACHPDYVDLDEKRIKRALRTAQRRFRDRMVAARMARAFFQEAVTGQPAVLVEPMQRVSLNELSILVQSESGESDPDNVEKRAWGESRPIIHLASALDAAGQLAAAHGREIAYDMQDLALHRSIVELAQVHEEIVLSDPRFGIRPDALIRLRWEE